MKQSKKRLFAVVLCLAMIVSMLSHGAPVYAAETEYQIYPIPHEMTYQDGNYDILSKVNVVYESGIDDVTKDRMEAILETKDTTVTVSDAKQDGKTNILVGIYGSDEYVDSYVEKNYSIDTDVFGKYSGHYVISDEGEIIVLGVDTDAAFYGITSLKHIFAQMDGMNIRNFTIEDYADTNIRGFIEGYYGIPWSNENRMSLMEFGGEFKMTSYVFAPKDDSYHKELWREEYPADKLAGIQEMVELGNSVKCRFVWTAHPFMGGFDAANVDGEIEALLAKFDQLYGIGVRQFGVLADDVGSISYDVLIQMMTAVSEWAAEKGDVYDSVFCPAGYNHAWQNYNELPTLDAAFPEDIQIFWTGEAVCQPVEQKTLDHFRYYNKTTGQNDATERRAPLFWLNWPVNDINGERLMMGKGSLLHTDIDVTDLAGVVTNPMQEAQASKVAIFAVADYAWNVADFDDDKSWADSFAYIDADASEELHTLAKHMSNPEPNGHGLVLAESEELQPLINEFKSKLASGQSIAETGTQLAAEMDVIIAASEGFFEKSQNDNMKEELTPFVGSLKDLATAIRNYALAAVELEKGDQMAAFEYFIPGATAMKNSKNHIRQGLGSTNKVTPGSTHLIPLAETIEKAIADEINEFALGGDNAGTTEFTAQVIRTTDGWGYYNGTDANVIDGDDSTYVWYNVRQGASSNVNTAIPGDYIGVKLSQPITLGKITVLQGKNDSDGDYFSNATLQYSVDGQEWIDIETYDETHQISIDVSSRNITAQYVRLVNNKNTGWVAFREFTVKEGKGVDSTAYTNVDAYEDVDAVLGTDTHELPAMDDVTLAPGEYIGLKLDRIHELDAVDVAVSEEGLTVQTSENSVEWAGIDAENARYIRIMNDTDADITFDISRFVVTTVEAKEKSIESTNYTSFEGDIAALFDGDWTSACQFANSQNVGKYVVIDLGSEVAFNSFKAVCTDGEWDFVRHGKFSVSANGEDWTEIMTIGNQDSENEGEAENNDNINDVLPNHEISYNTKSVTGLDVAARYLKFEVTRTKVGADKWVRFQEFEINGGEYIPTVNDPTVECPEEASDNQKSFMTDKDLFTAYTWNGDMIFHESEEEALNTVKIIQNGISNANVYVRLAGSDTYGKIGTLSEAISEFTVAGEILDVKISTASNTECSVTEISFSAKDGEGIVPSYDEVFRISGKDRYATGYAAADELKEVLGVDKFDAVVVATGKNFADALSGSYLAIVKNAPIILTNGKDDNVAELHAYIKENVNANGTVYILGGTAAVPAAVEAIEGYTVKRLAGSTRYETNLDILAEAGISGRELIVATGKEFADSLSASATGRPILLVKPGAALSAEQKAIAEAVKNGNIYVVGGTGAVAETTAAELETYATVERIAGAGRQETSKLVAEKFFPNAKEVVVASAKNFPDGLCGGPLAAAMDAPLLLTTTGKTEIAEGYVQENGIASGVVLGGTGALSDGSVVDVFGLESAEDIVLK